MADCLGVEKDDIGAAAVLFSEIDVSELNSTEGCRFGTKGPLCSLCVEGYNRDINECTVCVNEIVPVRLAIVIMVLVCVFLLANRCRKKMQDRWIKYKSLYRDLIRVAAINITFAQINSSLTFVIDVEWPIEWSEFLRHFDFVNIDVMSIIGEFGWTQCPMHRFGSV